MQICSQCNAVLGGDAEVCPSDGAAATAVTGLPNGAVLGGYRIDAELGEGGMGFVYEATHEVLGRRCAVKLLRPEFSANHQVVTRFLQEAKAVNLINNRHIVNVYDYGDDIDGLVYFVMEYLEGQTLSDLMTTYSPMTPVLFTHVFVQVLEGLAAAHENQIVHRDLKPENVFVIAKSTNPLFIKLLDFGVAKLRGEHAVEDLTVAGQLIGTPKFMSPEQFRGQAVDARSDVFSLGIMMYAAATRNMPFPGKELSEIALGIIKETQRPITERVEGFPKSLSDLVDKAMEKEPERRFADAREMLSAMLEIRDELDPDSEKITAFLREHVGDPNAEINLGAFTPPPPDSIVESPSKRKTTTGAAPKKSGGRIAIGAAIAAVLAGGVGFAVLSGGDGESSSAKVSGTATEDTATATPAAAKTLVGSLEGPGELTRSLAADAMKTLWDNSDEATRRDLVVPLSEVGSKATEPLLILALADGPPSAVVAAKALAEHDSPASKEALFAALEGAGPQLEMALASSLLTLGDERARKPLQALLSETRHQAVAAMTLATHGGDETSLQVLKDVFVETPPWKGRWLDAATGLLVTGDAAAEKALTEGLEAKSKAHQAEAATALARAGKEVGQEFLSNLVADARSDGRGPAALVLAHLGHPDAKLFVPVGLMSDEEPAQITAIAILSRLGGDELRKQAKRLVTLAETATPALSMAALAALANCPD